VIQQSYHEANRCVDTQANLGRNMSIHFMVYESCPIPIKFRKVKDNLTKYTQTYADYFNHLRPKGTYHE